MEEIHESFVGTWLWERYRQLYLYQFKKILVSAELRYFHQIKLHQMST